MLGTLSITHSTALWCFVFALIGAHAYVTDRKIGVKIYAKIHKWSTPPGTPQGPERGLIYNRSNQVRWGWATVIATVNAAIMIGWRHEDPRMERRKKMFEALDRVESGEIDVTDELHKAATEKIGAMNRFADRIAAWLAAKSFVKKKASVQQGASPTAAAPFDPKEERKAREILKRYN